MITQDLITNPSEFLRENTQKLSLPNILSFLQDHYYLPYEYMNTTFGVVSVADSIRSGHSRILQTIIAQPDVQSTLLSFNHHECTQCENKEDIAYWHVQEITEIAHQQTHLRLQFLRPIFSLEGWNDVLQHLFFYHDRILQKAFQEIKEMCKEEDLQKCYIDMQKQQIHKKQLYLHEYSLNQLRAEANAIQLLIHEFDYYFNDDYSVADWLQGLIEVFVDY